MAWQTNASEREEAVGFSSDGGEASSRPLGSRLGGGEEGGDFAQFSAGASNGGGHGVVALCGGGRKVLGVRGGGRRSFAAVAHDFESLAGTGEGVPLAVDQVLDFERQLDVAAAVEALAGSAFIGLELREFCLPKAQDVGFHATDAGYIADLEIQAVGDGGRVDAGSGELNSH